MKALKLTVAATLAFLLVPVGVSLAVDSKGRYYALGVGKRTCKEYIEFREKRIKDFTPEDYKVTEHIVEHWVAGYLTGHNYYVADTYNVKGNTTVGEMMVWLEKFCKKDQDEHFAEAVVALAGDLNVKRVKTGTTAEPQEVTSGTVSVKSTSIAIGVGVSWGDGMLKYRGREYNFSVSGLTLVDVGISSVSANGEVSSLGHLSDFAGTYVAFKGGAALAGGGSGLLMKNQHDVVISLTSTQKGVSLALGPAGLTIKLKE